MVMELFAKKYKILASLGSGGFARTFKARHTELDYVRALKVLDRTVTDENDKVYTDFIQECKLLMRIGNGNNTHIVRIYHPQLVESKVFFEMDNIEGFNLDEYVEEFNGFVPASEVINLAVDISDALRFCHHDIYRKCMDRVVDGIDKDPKDGSKLLLTEEKKQELVEKYRVFHNDIHPGNIMRENEDGRYILLDFGLAIQDGNNVRLSRRQNGVEEYKAPEKYDMAEILTAGIDIYSFGAVLFFFLTGRPPFIKNNGTSNDTMERYNLMNAHQKEPVPDIFSLRQKAYSQRYPNKILENPDYPSWLEEVIYKCLEKDPKNRFRDGYELNEHICSCLSEETGKRDREQFELQRKLETMENQYAALIEEFNELRKVCDSNRSKRAGVLKSARQVVHEYNMLKTEHKETGRQLKKHEEQLSDERQARLKVEAELTNRISEVKQQERKKADELCEILKQENGKLSKRLEGVEIQANEEREQLSSKIQRLQGLVAELKAERTKLMAVISELQLQDPDKCEEYMRQIQMLEKDKDILAKDLQKLKSDYWKLQSNYEAMVVSSQRCEEKQKNINVQLKQELDQVETLLEKTKKALMDCKAGRKEVSD